MALERELEVYRQKLPQLLDREGQYAVISGDALLGVFESYEDALKAGYSQATDLPFLVRRIEQVETIHWFTRDIVDGCRF